MTTVGERNWVFVSKKRLSWFSEMLQVEGMSREFFQSALNFEFEFRNARMAVFHEFLDGDEITTLSEKIDYLCLNASDEIQHISRRSYKLCREFSDIGEKIACVEWEEADREQLTTALETFYAKALVMIPVVYFEPEIGALIESCIHQVMPDMSAEAASSLMLKVIRGSKDLAVVREQRGLLAIAADFEREGLGPRVTSATADEVLAGLPLRFRLAVEQHSKQFGWINTDDIYGRAWTPEDFLGRIQFFLRRGDCISRLEEAKNRDIVAEREAQDGLAQLVLNKKLLTLIEIARTYGHLRTFRTEAYVKTLHDISGLLKSCAAKVGYAPSDAVYLSGRELQAGLAGKKLLVDITERRAGMAYRMVDRVLQVFFGNAAIGYARECGLMEQPSDVQGASIRGTVANAGLARGTAAIVNDLSDLDKVKEGDVLLASMTIPEFVPAMERAAAFVTDEGGLTSHAAILSRELDVPCIVGTAIGTKMFRDGDMLEVDANFGEVRRVNS